MTESCPVCTRVKRLVSDRLFDLRMKKSEMTPELRFLSHIELIFHEADEEVQRMKVVEEEE